MKLTSEQLEAVSHDGNTLIIACPGSGKTTTLIRKLVQVGEAIKNTTRKVACITYTNAAVFEIEDRLRVLAAPWLQETCEVCTIHTFCLNEILRNYCWRIPAYQYGFKILPPNTEDYQQVVRNLIRDYQLSIDAADKFENLNFEPDGTPIAPPEIGIKAARAFWRRLSEQQYMDFPSMLYQSYKLLAEHPSICRAMSSRFSWFLIDEFQDTSALQVEIFRLIASHERSNFFLVGDPHQSIFGFAGGRPDLMTSFASEIDTRTFSLSNNFRSSKLIVQNAEELISRVPPMIAVGTNKDFIHGPRFLQVAGFEEGIEDYFLSAVQSLEIPYSECAVLAPTWFTLLPIARRFRALGVPIIGPGARPYKRIHILSRLAEQVCAYISEPKINRLRKVQRELYLLLTELNGKANYEALYFEGAVTALNLIRTGERLSRKHEGALDWLQAVGIKFEEILIEDEWIFQNATGVLQDSSSQMQKEIQSNIRGDAANLTVQEIGLFGVPEKSLKLLTMHRSKGHEFDAVALIDVHDHVIPHRRSQTPAGIAEARRLLYVATTRPRKLLLYFTLHGRVVSRFLGDRSS